MKIQSRYRGVKGFVRIYTDALRHEYMITQKAQERARVLVFWEKHGLKATLDAFPYKRSTLFHWKQLWKQGNKQFEALNEQSKAPKTKRKRLWDSTILQEIRRLRELHPNLGEKKLYPFLYAFCSVRNVACPKPATIGRLIHDAGGIRMAPQTISHFGRVRRTTRKKVIRKPKGFQATYPGHVVALDTIERFVDGCRRYIITFEDVYTRFAFAWCTTSHGSLAAQEFLKMCQRVFPIAWSHVLTDNGSEFQKHFSEELEHLQIPHLHTYPKTPKMNAHVERFNRTIQEDFIDYHVPLLRDPVLFNRNLMDYLIFYNCDRVHDAFKNKLSPLQFLLQSQHLIPNYGSQKSKTTCGHTVICN